MRAFPLYQSLRLIDNSRGDTSIGWVPHAFGSELPADAEGGFEDDLGEGAFGVFEAGEGEVGRLLAHIVAGQGDGGDGGGEDVEPFGIVGTGDFDLLGDGDAAFQEGAEDAGHHEEVGGEDGGGLGGVVEEAVGGFAAGDFGPIAGFDEGIVGEEFSLFQCGAPAFDAVHTGGEGEFAGDEADGFVALFDEMVDGEAGAGDVVGADGVAIEILGDAADADDGALFFDETLDSGFAAGGHEEEQGVDLATAEEAQIAGLGGDFVVGIPQKKGVAVFGETVLDAADDAGVEGVSDVGDQHADGLGGAGLQAARDGVGGIVQLLHGGEDAFGQFRANVGRFIDDARDCVGRDASEFSDVVDCCH